MQRRTLRHVLAGSTTLIFAVAVAIAVGFGRPSIAASFIAAALATGVILALDTRRHTVRLLTALRENSDQQRTIAVTAASNAARAAKLESAIAKRGAALRQQITQHEAALRERITQHEAALREQITQTEVLLHDQVTQMELRLIGSFEAERLLAADRHRQLFESALPLAPESPTAPPQSSERQT